VCVCVCVCVCARAYVCVCQYLYLCTSKTSKMYCICGANSQQLTGAAGANQVKGAEVAMTQNIGGAGASVYTHVFVKE
jgi:hypothetical protein